MSTRIADADVDALLAPYRRALAQALAQAALDTLPTAAAVQSPSPSQAGADAAPATGARRSRSTPRPAAAEVHS
jgi:hypothetical protein